MCDPVFDVLPAVDRSPCKPDRRADHFGLRRVDRGAHGVREGVLGDDDGGARVVEDEGDLVGPETEVDRHQDRSEARTRERQNGELPAIVAHQGQTIALGGRVR